ncbi:MAG TPA: hypothetical protein PL041_10175 [Melioribacteraceae bacterium]|nr:hypothetical protein [Melioribacteraceae bacterium]
MTYKLKTIIIIIFLLTSYNYSQIYKLETKNSKIIYFGKSYDYLIPHVAATTESAYQFNQKYWNFYTDEKVTVLLNDFSDVGNGGTMTIPYNLLLIGIAPFDFTFDVLPANERFQWLMNHELTHLVMADKSTGLDAFFRKVFLGKIATDNENPLSMFYSYLSSPRWYSPRWYHEGIAVFMETWMSGGLGRVLGGYDEMVFRAMVKENAYFYRPIGLETEGTTVDFQVGVNSYLYGARFINYLSATYGMENVRAFYDRDSLSHRFYATQFNNVFNKDIVSVWDEWIDFENEFQKNNIQKITQYPLTNVKEFTKENLGSVSRPYFNKYKNEIICAINRPGDLAALISMNLDNGKINKITDVESPGLYYVTNFAYDKTNNRAFVTTHNQNWRGLKVVDLNNGDEETIFDYIRISELVYSEQEKALYGMQIVNGRTAIVKLTGDFTTIQRLYSIPYGYSYFDIDISPNGKLLSGTFADQAGKQKLLLFNLDSLNYGKIDTTFVYEFEDNSTSNFVFCKDGKSLIGTSYYTGVSNVYQINIENKDAKLLTNTDIGYFRPIEISDDTLLVFEYNTKGLRPLKINKEFVNDAASIDYLGMKSLEKNPEFLNYIPEPASNLNNENLIISEIDYNSVLETGLESFYPIIEGYKDFVAYGVNINLSDDILISKAKIKASYTNNNLLPQKERLHLSLNYNYWQWRFNAALNKTNFFDLFGPTKVSRAGYYFNLGYDYLINLEKPIDSRLIFNIAFYGDLQKLPQYQNINAGFSELTYADITYNYSKYFRSLGGVDNESGYEIKSNINGSYFNDEIVPSATIQLKKAMLVKGIRNSSVWVNTSAGRVFSDTKSSFGKFYFGGFGNNYIDRLSVQRYREIESFPGKEINELAGKDFAKIGLEWNLPPVMFKQFGFLSAYVRFARLSFFQDNLITDVTDKNVRAYFHNVGAQLDFELVFFTLLKSTLSVGYAKAFNKYLKPTEEFMISLKLL